MSQAVAGVTVEDLLPTLAANASKAKFVAESLVGFHHH